MTGRARVVLFEARCTRVTSEQRACRQKRLQNFARTRRMLSAACAFDPAARNFCGGLPFCSRKCAHVGVWGPQLQPFPARHVSVHNQSSMDEEPRRQRSQGFREAHRELSLLIDTMKPQLVPSLLQRDANHARAMLSMLAGKLTVHLAMEDHALYPRLATHNNQDVRKLAEQLKQEMGGILLTFKEYLARWPTAENIQANSSDFVHETREIFAALEARIAKEDAQIFPKLDEC